MQEIGRRHRNQPAPPHVIFEALTELDRPGVRLWLELLDDEHRPQLLSTRASSKVVWSSIWDKRSDAVIEFDLLSDGGTGTDLSWTVFVNDPIPDDVQIGHTRKRMNVLINADLRYLFGQ
jgi:hypothetical protein